uniref:Uncharacterized protein n=1 Tax=Sinocyclocheilus anshuiensis TaxID=1608454 RepID=A0A671Q8F7_9TELE
SSPLSGSSSRGASSGQGSSSSFSWPWSSEPDPYLPGMSQSQRLITFGTLFALLGAAILKLIAIPTPGAAVCLCSLVGTLYAALSLHSTLLTALGACLQISAIVGSHAGVVFVGGTAASAIKRTVTSKAMPV